MKELVAIIGDAFVERGSLKDSMAFSMGKALIDNGYRLQTGGMGGVMQAACAGAKSSDKACDGDTVALLPTFSPLSANKYADICIPTGMDILRNALVANAKAVIMIGGGAGTLSEAALAWSLKRLVIAFENVDGWSSKLANTVIDKRKRYPFEDKVFGVSSPEQAIDLLKDKIALYDNYHKGIVF